MGDKVDELRDAMSDEDELLILSDHGMTNELIDDQNVDFGVHSFRAFAATTSDDPLPESVFDVRDWIEAHVEDAEEEDAMEMPKERLRELGYIH